MDPPAREKGERAWAWGCRAWHEGRAAAVRWDGKAPLERGEHLERLQAACGVGHRVEVNEAVRLVVAPRLVVVKLPRLCEFGELLQGVPGSA
jgi:ABC-type phosphonate transport system ATPase subunit